MKGDNVYRVPSRREMRTSSINRLQEKKTGIVVGRVETGATERGRRAGGKTLHSGD